MKREYTALIDSDWQDRTIKEYLREELNASSGIIKSLKARNGIYVNKAPAFVSRVLKKGEILTLILEEEEAVQTFRLFTAIWTSYMRTRIY